MGYDVRQEIMSAWFSAPSSQREIDRNLFIIGWLMVLSAVWFVVDFHPLPAALSAVGATSRLWIVALRLPVGSRAFYRWLIPVFLILSSILIWIDAVSIDYRVYFAVLFGFAFYADFHLRRNQNAQSGPRE